MNCDSKKFFEFNYERFLVIISTVDNRIHINISDGISNLLNSFFPIEDNIIDLELSHIPKILFNNNCTTTKITL